MAPVGDDGGFFVFGGLIAQIVQIGDRRQVPPLVQDPKDDSLPFEARDWGKKDQVLFASQRPHGMTEQIARASAIRIRGNLPKGCTQGSVVNLPLIATPSVDRPVPDFIQIAPGQTG